LREIVKERKLSILSISKMSGLSREHYRYLLLGKVSVSLYSMGRICNALGLDPSAMIEEEYGE
jgi:transcriptional regulator with XRE-family HTH domain